MYNISEQDLAVLRQAYEVLGRIMANVPGQGMPASPSAPVQNSFNRRAEKRQHLVKYVLQNLEMQLGSGFMQFVNPSLIQKLSHG